MKKLVVLEILNNCENKERIRIYTKDNSFCNYFEENKEDIICIDDVVVINNKHFIYYLPYECITLIQKEKPKVKI